MHAAFIWADEFKCHFYQYIATTTISIDIKFAKQCTKQGKSSFTLFFRFKYICITHVWLSVRISTRQGIIMLNVGHCHIHRKVYNNIKFKYKIEYNRKSEIICQDHKINGRNI